MSNISLTTFPRVSWKENIGLRKVLARAVNTSKNNEQRLESLSTLLRYTTAKVNEALLELETGQVAAVMPNVPAIAPALNVPALDIQLQGAQPVMVDVQVAPITLINVEK